MKSRSSPIRFVAGSFLVGFALSGNLSLPLQGNPEGGRVVAGEVEIRSGSAQRLDVIQRSARGAIDWQSFNIGAGEHVNFAQPSTQAVTLNRVVGGDPSAIFGRLTSNGRVFLVNPNGVLFGPSAQVDVGGLLATTAGLSNENFLADRLIFDRAGPRSATIVNQGRISTAADGLVALVAPGVENSGVISARLGRVALAAGDTFTLDLYGDQLVTLAVSDAKLEEIAGVDGRAGRGPSGSFVRNSGVIAADGGRVWLTTNAAREVVDGVVNLTGSIRARSLENRNGEIVLVGQRVEVASGATLDVSAAEVRGDGGSILVRAENDTQFAGRALANGGVLGGDGGMIEISGDNRITFRGEASAAAPHGRPGTVLFDPPDLRIGVGLDVEPDAISRLLQAGTNVTQAATNDLFVNGRIDGRGGVAGARLTLNAGRNVELNDDILTNAGAVEVNAATGKITMGAGSATTMSGGKGTAILTGGGKVTLSASGDIVTRHVVNAGGLTVTSATGEVFVNEKLVVGGPVTVSGKTVTLSHSIFTNGQAIELGSTDGAIILNPASDELLTATASDIVTRLFHNNKDEQKDPKLIAGSGRLSSNEVTTTAVTVDLTTRQITVGSGGGSIIFRGEVTIAPALHGNDNSNSPPSFFYTLPGNPLAKAAPDYVSLSLVAGTGEITFSKGIETVLGASKGIALKDFNPAGAHDQSINTVDLGIASASKVTASAPLYVNSISSSIAVVGSVNEIFHYNINVQNINDPPSFPPIYAEGVRPPAGNAATGGIILSVPLAPALPRTNPPSLTSNSPVVGAGNPGGVAAAAESTTDEIQRGNTPDLLFASGGRGVGRSADLGRHASTSGPAADVFSGGFQVVEADAEAEGGSVDRTYLQRDAFGRDSREHEKKRKPAK